VILSTRPPFARSAPSSPRAVPAWNTFCAVRFGCGDVVDASTACGGCRIAFGCHDHGHRAIGGKLWRGGEREVTFGRGLQERNKIAFQPQHQHLAFGIAEAAIVFD